MQILKHKLDDINLQYDIEKLGKAGECLFIDIETTGFTAKSSKLYLIGCAYYCENTWNSIQFFADDYSEEKSLIEEFFSFAQSFNILIHYNGNNFDIPYLNAKIIEHNLEYSFEKFKGIDIYKRISPYKAFLKLENLKLKSIESFLKINRQDQFSGGDLIGEYHSYVLTKDKEKLNLLLLHNFDDIKGMLNILPILAYTDLFMDKLKVTKVSANYYTDINKVEKAELIMTFDPPSKLTVPISSFYDNCYFTGNENQAMLRVPLYEGELKYFYANYKEYYYLPLEDVALHKSVATFVDKDHREPCKASNCYTKHSGKFLPQWDVLINPFFKPDYNSKDMFFELTKERQTDRELFSSYASHVLTHMYSKQK